MQVRIPARLVPLVAMARRIIAEYTRTRVSLSAGGLAYFVGLALIPAAVVLGSVAGLFVTPAQVTSGMDALVSHNPALASSRPVIEGVVSAAASASATSFTLATLASVLLAIYASSYVVVGARLALHSIYGIERARYGIAGRMAAAVATFLAVVVVALLVVLVTVLPRVLSAMGIEQRTSILSNEVVDWVLLVALLFLGVRTLLRRVGGSRSGWWAPGPLVATAWIAVVSGGLGLYVKLSTVMGAALVAFGSIIVVLLWTYLCFLGLFIGALIDSDRSRNRAGKICGVV
jgi:membrane protein